MSATDVRKNLLMLPWVKVEKRDVRCEGLKWSEMSGKAYREHLAGNTPERVKCKRRARYVFRATRRLRSWDYAATSGSYCTTHLTMQLFDHEAERRRAEKFWDKNGWWRDGVFGIHPLKSKEQ